MASGTSVSVPGGVGKGDTQGMKPCSGDPLNVGGSSVKQGDLTRTRMTGGLGHATLHTKTPSSGHTFRKD